MASDSSDDPTTDELRDAQLRRLRREERAAGDALDEDEAIRHARRAERAGYLVEKLEERAESERDR